MNKNLRYTTLKKLKSIRERDYYSIYYGKHYNKSDVDAEIKRKEGAIETLKSRGKTQWGCRVIDNNL